MPTKRSPKKSRRPGTAPLEVDPAVLAALTVTPADPVPLAVAPAQAGTRSTPPPPSRARSARSVRAGSTTVQGQNRRYAFRRS
ncbi:hypothetical protein [Micromonospora rifamycinica]|uniref:Uncharacterized protein n=1 Tax=Micromonospora rifamycinica TaxID=291594 RepID=A0A109IKI2_9ACTN|nr:hypothetical protein [Micromonospora rifamycinica]KWV32230.1 hypothetical protein AWV63_13475 [Micromonospora rifamycinica]SCG80527.1 hypothetical protein GA0070623_5094 [Micromonospora rifamycinica]